MTKLSVNINKIATLRNARGHNVPNVIEAAINIQRFGAQGITVHPRPDERHITYADVIELKEIVNTEFNIEGNPTEKKFIDLVLQVKPTQVTLVPDSNSQLTSNHGWDTIKNKDFLIEVISEFKKHGIRTSIFVDPIEQFINGAQLTGTDRIELYTESYANTFLTNKEKAILNFVKASQLAQNLNLGVNAGHDLNLENLNYFKNNIPNLLEDLINESEED